LGLRYILGSTGTGKTSLCLEEIMKSNFGGKNLVLIVPEQFTLESENKLVRLSTGAIIKCQVLSFNRLAFHLFKELGKSGVKILEQDGKIMLLRKIVLTIKDGLRYFAGSSNKQGFMENLSDMVSEFYRFNIGADKLLGYLDSVKDRENLFLKLNDIYKIYKGFTDYIHEKYISADETLDILSGLIEHSEYLKGAIIWIDNFNNFNPQEYKVIEKLIKHCIDVNVCMNTNSGRYTFDFIKAYDPYYETKLTISKITKLAKENNIKIENPIFLKDNWRHKNNIGLDFLSSNYFKFDSEPFEGACPDIEIFKAQNIYSEISETAKRIHELVKHGGYRYREVAVVTASVEENERIIRNTFFSYDIPCFFDASSDILSHPLTELIRSLVEVVVSNFSYEGVFRFLKTNMAPIAMDDIDMLENYVLANGVRGYKWQLKRWKYGFNDGLYDEVAIHETRDAFLNAVGKFTNGLKYNTVLSIKDFCLKIYEALEALQVTKTLENWILAIDDKNSVILRQHKQIWPKVTGMLDKMVEILGDEKTTLKEFGKILDAGLEEIEMSIIPPSIDCVIIGDYKRTKLPEVRALFFIGVNEGKIPIVIKEKGLITDDERQLLKDRGIELEPDSKHKTMQENFLIYESFTKASGFLWFSYSIGTLLGKPLQPSNVIRRVKKLFPGLPESISSAGGYMDMPKPAFEYLGKALKKYSAGGGLNPVDIEVYSYFKKDILYKDKLSLIEKLLFFEQNPKYLKEGPAYKLHGKELVTSVTRLEHFVKCPFSYFVKYSLTAKNRKQFEINQMDLGSLFHNVIERFSKTLVQSGLNYREVNKRQISEIVEGCVDELIMEDKPEIFSSTAKLKYALKRIKRISKESVWALSEHIKKGSFEPLADELEFSFNTPMTGIVIELKGGNRIYITGRIDRVDFYDYDGARYIKVIDYKSGGTEFDLTDIYYGMQFQILLYLDAFIKNAPQAFNNRNLKILPGGVFYFSINDPILDYNDVVYETLEALKLKEYRLDGLVLKDMHVVSAMDNEIDGDSPIIPVGLKKGLDFTASSSVATLSEFENIMAHINERIEMLAEEIFKGNIDVWPYKKGDKTGCDYCEYKAICQIGASGQQNKYNVFKKVLIDQF
jgi:ATP-dependent helicase/nuclease subunit B